MGDGSLYFPLQTPPNAAFILKKILSRPILVKFAIIRSLLTVSLFGFSGFSPSLLLSAVTYRMAARMRLNRCADEP